MSESAREGVGEVGGHGQAMTAAGVAARIALGALVLGILILALRALGLTDWLALERLMELRRWVEAQGALAPLVFVAGYALAELVFVPALPITILGGLAFGPLWGTLYVSLGATAGAALAFLAARHLMRHAVERWIEQSPRLGRVDRAVAEHGWRIIMITRLVPLFPFNLQNFAYGLTRIGFWTFVGLTWLCILPGTAAFTLAAGSLVEGRGDVHQTLRYLGLAGLLVVGASLLPRWLRRRSRAASELLDVS